MGFKRTAAERQSLVLTRVEHEVLSAGLPGHVEPPVRPHAVVEDVAVAVVRQVGLPQRAPRRLHGSWSRSHGYVLEFNYFKRQTPTLNLFRLILQVYSLACTLVLVLHNFMKMSTVAPGPSVLCHAQKLGNMATQGGSERCLYVTYVG